MRIGSQKCRIIAPLVLLPNIILFAEIDEDSYRFGGKQLKRIDDFDLNKRGQQSSQEDQIQTERERGR
jgi:hypothetical protein